MPFLYFQALPVAISTLQEYSVSTSTFHLPPGTTSIFLYHSVTFMDYQQQSGTTSNLHVQSSLSASFCIYQDQSVSTSIFHLPLGTTSTFQYPSVASMDYQQQ